MGQYSIDPDFAELIVETILRYKPDHVLELGSGTSTVICGYALRYLTKGSLTSVDHDLKYTDITRKEIQRHGIDDIVRILHAPLKDIELHGRAYRWYDPGLLEQMLPVDLLIVDGPPARSGKFIRYPALPMLYSRMSKASAILVDDASRYEEGEMVRLWLSEFENLQANYIPTVKSACLLLLDKGQAGLKAPFHHTEGDD